MSMLGRGLLLIVIIAMAMIGVVAGEGENFSVNHAYLSNLSWDKVPAINLEDVSFHVYGNNDKDGIFNAQVTGFIPQKRDQINRFDNGTFQQLILGNAMYQNVTIETADLASINEDITAHKLTVDNLSSQWGKLYVVFFYSGSDNPYLIGVGWSDNIKTERVATIESGGDSSGGSGGDGGAGGDDGPVGGVGAKELKKFLLGFIA